MPLSYEVDVAEEACQYGKFRSKKLLFFFFLPEEVFSESSSKNESYITGLKANYLTKMPEHTLKFVKHHKG